MISNDDELYQFTPENLRSYASEIRDLRSRLICDVEDTGADPEAEHLFLLSLAALDLAYHNMKLAAIKQSQGVKNALHP